MLEKVAVVDELQNWNNRNNSQKGNVKICSLYFASWFLISRNSKNCVVTKNISQHFSFTVSAYSSIVSNPIFGVLLEYKGSNYGSWIDNTFSD